MKSGNIADIVKKIKKMGIAIPGKQFLEGDYKTVYELYCNGYTLQQIADSFGDRTRQAIYSMKKTMEKNGVVFPKVSKPEEEFLLDEIDETIIKLRGCNKYKDEEIAKQIGISESELSKRVKIMKRHKINVPRKCMKIDRATDERIRLLLDLGYTAKQIAGLLNHTDGSVYRRINIMKAEGADIPDARTKTKAKSTSTERKLQQAISNFIESRHPTEEQLLILTKDASEHYGVNIKDVYGLATHLVDSDNADIPVSDGSEDR